MQKFFQRMMLMAALFILPWAMQAQGVGFSYDFEPGSADSSHWTVSNLTGTSAWVIGSAQHSGAGSRALYVSNDNGASASYGTGAALDYFYRTVTLPAGDYVLSFDWKCQGESSFDYLRVALVPDATTLTASTTVISGLSASALPTGWIALDGGSKLNLDSTWTTKVTEFNLATAGTYKIAFIWRNDGSVHKAPGACVDNIVFQENTCPAPLVSSSAVGSDYADLTWIGANALAYQLMVGENGFSPDTASLYSLTDTFYTVQNLLPNTLYSAKVRSICGAGDTSLWSAYSFRTGCVALDSLPYFQDFETASTGSTTSASFVNCWNRLNNGTTYFGVPYVSSSTSYNHTTGGARGLYWSASTTTTYGDYQCIAFPAVDATVFPINTLQVSFWAKATAASYHPVIEVGVMTNPNDITSFQSVGTIHVEGNVWSLYEMPLSLYAGSGNVVALKATRPTTSWFAAIDDITLDLIPNCPHPGVPYASTVDANSMDVSWSEYGSASAWEVEYATSEITPGLGLGTSFVAFDTTTTLSGLQPNTVYYVYVRALCGAGDTSDWTYAEMRTGCGLLSTFPYYQNFEAEDVTTNTNHDFAACWGHLNNGTTYFGYPNIRSSSAYNHTTGGSKGLYWSASTTATTYGDYYCIVLPQIDTDAVSISSLQLNFWSKASSASYHPVFQVGVMTDATDISTFQTVQTVNVSGTTWTEYEASLNAFDGAGSFVAIKATRPTSTWYAYMDDIMLAVGSSCERPNNFALAYATPDSVVLSWTPGATETEWVVGYGETETVVYDTLFVLEQFVPYTDYSFTLRAICGSGDTSLPQMLTVHTPCAFQDSLPYAQNFEAETTGTSTSASFVACWNRLNNGTTSFGYPYVSGSSTYNHTTGGTKSLYWYASTTATTYGDYLCAVFPAFDASVYPINTLQVSFWARSSSSTSHPVFQVGVMSNPSDIASFVPVASVSVEGTAWMEYDVPLGSYSGNGTYVAIKATRPSSSWTAYMDDVTLDFAPACLPPVNLTVSNIVADSATLSWTPGSEDNLSWNVTYVTAGQQPVSLYGVSDSTLVLSGLVNNADYTVYVQTDCNGDTSNSTMATFHSACADVTLPYTENFDSLTTSTTSATGVQVPCWSSLMTGSATYQSSSYLPKVYYSATYANSGSYSLRLYGVGYHALPRFEAPLDTLQISFSLYTTSANYRLALYAVEDTGYAFIADVSAPTTSTHTPVSLFLSAGDYHGNSHQLAFRNYNATATTYYSYNYIDDIVVDYLPACPPVSNVEAVQDSNAITLTWYENGAAASWTVEYGATGFTPGLGTTLTATTESATITGLTANTLYDFYITPVCSGATAVMATFSTTGSYQGMPYSCNFENAAQNAAWNLVNGTCTNKWYIGGAVNHGGDSSLYISDNNGAGNGYNNTSATMVYAYVDMKFPAAGDYAYSFDWRANGESTFDFIRAAIVPFSVELAAGTTLPTGLTASALPAGFIALDGGSKLNLSTNWQTRSEVVHVSTPGVYHVVFAWRNDASGGVTPPAAIDNFEMSLMTCPRPDSLTVSNITQHTADVAWVEPGSASTWQWTLDGSTIHTVSSTQLSLTGLPASSVITLGVRSVCGAGDTSFWRYISFNTVCGPVAMPYLQDFEMEATTTSTTANANFANCWHHLNNGTTYMGYPYISGNATYNYTTNGTKGLYWRGSNTAGSYGEYSCIVLPESAVAVDSLQLSFWTKTTSASYSPVFRIGVMTDPSNINTFVPVDTVTVTTGVAWTQYEARLDGYADTGRYVAIRSDLSASIWYAYMDDIMLDYIPSCMAVTDLEVTQATQTSITLDWVDVSTPVSWEIEYGAIGFTQGQGTTVTVTTHPAQITGLTPASGYDFYVRPNCGNGYGYWRDITYYTRCNPASVPFVQDFELETTTTSSTPNITFATCWTHHNNATTYMGYPYIAGTATSNHSANGTKGLYWGASTTSNTYGDYYCVVLPEVEPSVDSLQLSFWAKATSSSYVPVFKIGVMTDPDDVTTFVGVDTITLTTGTAWTEFEVLLNTYSDTGKFVAIKADRPASAWYAYMDDITLDYIPSCPKVTDVEVDTVSLNSITLDWIDAVTPTNWEVEYGVAGFTQGQGTMVTVTSHPAQITGLNSATLYDFYVRPFCGGTDYGYWSQVVSAATECAAISAPYSENFDAVSASTYSTEGILPTCWEGYSNGTTATYAPHVVGSGSYWYADSANSLIMTSGSATYGNTKMVRLPEFVQPVNSLTMSFWAATESSSNGTLSIGYFTGDDFATDFVPVKSIAASSSTSHGSGSGEAASGFRDTVSFDSVPAEARYIGFKWLHSSSFYSCCIDDVVVTSTMAGCAMPQLGQPTLTAESADVVWNGVAGERFHVAMKSTSASVWNDSVEVLGNTYHFAGLLPETEYFYRVRKVCDSDQFSNWTIGSFTTDELPCSAPDTFALDEVNFTTASFSWTPVSSETHWGVYVWNTTFDSLYVSTATNYTVAGLIPNVSYNAAVMALCGVDGSIPSETMSDTIPFSTGFCDPVTDVSSTVGELTATITWTPGDNNNGVWDVRYGVTGFAQGDEIGTIAATTNSISISGLEAFMTYDAYVRAKCEEGVFSAWSSKTTFYVDAVGIHSLDGEGYVNIYPNPATGSTRISLSGVAGNVTLTLVDMNGRTVRAEQMVCDGTCVKVVDVEALAAGAYFVRISSDNYNAVKKLIVK